MQENHNRKTSRNASAPARGDDEASVAQWKRYFDHDSKIYRNLVSAARTASGSEAEDAAWIATGGALDRLLARPCIDVATLHHKLRFITDNAEVSEFLGMENDTFRILLSSLLCLKSRSATETWPVDLLDWDQGGAKGTNDLEAFEAVMGDYLQAYTKLIEAKGDEDAEITYGQAADDAFDAIMSFPCTSIEIVVRKARHLLTREEYTDLFREIPSEVNAFILSLSHVEGGAA